MIQHLLRSEAPPTKTRGGSAFGSASQPGKDVVIFR
jgi:hypothetical protein